MIGREQAIELVKIASDPVYFSTTCVQIKPDDSHTYQPFDPWPAQTQLIDDFDIHKYVILLKARQLGMTSCVLVYAMCIALVEPNSSIFLISKQKEDTYKLIEKLRLMWLKLPAWLKEVFWLTKDNSGSLAFNNGSIFLTFASNKSACDGLTGRLAVIDEADLIADLDRVLNGVMPAIAKGGQLIILSKSNKDLPESKFKKLFRLGMAGQSDFQARFLPWWSRPDRDQHFYDSESRNNASIDYMYENYPASVEEALAPRQENKRIPLKWLDACSPAPDQNGIRQWPVPLPTPSVLSGVPGLRILHEPEPGREYIIGCDLASGKGENPNLDDSAAVVLDKDTCRQMACLNDRVEPALFAEYVASLSRFFNKAGVLSELNGQWGGMFFQHMKDKCDDIELLKGLDDKPGFNTTAKSKSELYQRIAESARVRAMTITDQETFNQLASIEARTLEAPPGLHDDIAMAIAIANWACHNQGVTPFVIIQGPPEPKPEPEPAPHKGEHPSWKRMQGGSMFPRLHGR